VAMTVNTRSRVRGPMRSQNTLALLPIAMSSH
jgi:hypothetical protein